MGLLGKSWPLMAYLGLCAWYTYQCPYNKVEESFNTQAIHDLIYHGGDLEKYDHFEFPGVVPRTFLGAFLVAILTKIILFVTNLPGHSLSKPDVMLTSRLVLGGVSGVCWFRLQRAISWKFGSICANIFAILTLTQFHPIFYSSRTLPNTFGLCLVYLAYSSWFRGRERAAVGYLTACAAIFRFEIAVLLAGVFLTESFVNRSKIKGMLFTILMVGTLSTLTSVLFDSIMWDRWVWPEAQVFYFNVVMNKSSDWGTLPWNWYLQKALPNALLLAYPFALLGLFKSHVENRYIMPTVLFLGLFSCLPHKELRFVFYLLPVMNLMAASSIQNLAIESEKSKTLLKWILQLLLSGVTVLCLISSIVRVNISSRNYPGGEAMKELHSLVIEPNVSLHIDVFTAMNGCNRFLQLRSDWTYDKTENLHEDDLQRYSHLLSSVPVEGFKTLKVIRGFSGLKVSLPRSIDQIQTTFPFIGIREEDKIFILEKDLPIAQ